MATGVLITGASGLVGKRLTELLVQKGCRVSHLGRSKKSGTIPSYVWNVDKGEMDPASLEGVGAIINLAGTGVAEKRWTEQRKKDILESRTGAAELLRKTLANTNHQVQTLINASAIGIYGYSLSTNVLNEESPPGTDFLSQVVVEWEKAAERLSESGIRVVLVRIGIVLSERGGALTEMAGPVKYFIGSPFGTGLQMISWIHLDDLCGIFIKAIEDPTMKGSYNAVAPYPVTNKEITKAIGKALGRPVWPIHVPGFVLRIVVGPMADIVLNGAAISSKKIQGTGFTFQYPELDHALKDLFKK